MLLQTGRNVRSSCSGLVMTTVSLRHRVELTNRAARVVAYILTSQRQQARRELAEALGRAADLGLRAAGSQRPSSPLSPCFPPSD